MSADPIRQFGSRTEPFTEEKIEKARKTLAKLQGMHWYSDHYCPGLNGKHKAPCLPVDDVEWLFGYIDNLTAERDTWQQRAEEAEECGRPTTDLERIAEWHSERFPTATMEHIALKLAEETGEVCAAVIALAGNEHPERAASVVDECADVFIVLSVLVGRYFPFTPLMEAVQTKLATLASLPPVADEREGRE